MQCYQVCTSSDLPQPVSVSKSFGNMIFLIAIAILIPTFYVESASAQVDLMPSHDVAVTVSSGDFFNDGDLPEVVWSQVIRVKGAQWVRLHFSFLVLAHDQLGNTSSTLRITSLKDGAVQLLDGKTARQWRNTSAYFNGNAVRLELIAWPNGRMNRVTVDSVMAGEIPAAQESICDSIDDRTLSNDVRVGRTDGGCSGWLFNNRENCMLTAGHCASSTDVMLFNVPLSNSNGSYNFPGPDDQYAVDPSSMQLVDAGVGNDWCYFGCFPNSNTGLSALQAQGDSYGLVLPPGVSGGDEIRITGYGTTSSPVSPTWNGAQKTQVGPYFSFSGSALGYRTDTTGGNSGSPVIFESTGLAIGIHTHGGCGSGGSGNNSGTGANNGGFQNALANPLGICAGGVDFEYPSGRPSLLDPAGGTTVRVVAVNGGEEPQPGTGMLHYDLGLGFQSVAMSQVSPNVYDAVFPAADCGIVVKYYFSAENDLGSSFTDPLNAPASSYTVVSAENVQVAFEDDFETNLGWAVTGNASDGQWQRGVPAGGGDRGDPPTDGDGSGSCYLTDNVDGNSDVDNGSTILTSPVMDATVTSSQNAIISYYRWYSNDSGAAPMEDVFVVEISNNGGASWVNLETVGPTGTEVSGGWFQKSFCIDDILTPTSQMQIRFTASDLINGSVVEAAVDGIKIEIVECSSDPIVVVPASFQVTRGTYIAGGISELSSSDNTDLQIVRATNDVQSRTEFEVTAVSPTASPSLFAIELEGSVFARTTVNQTIELFNYSSSSWEEVDTSVATQFVDSVVTVSATDDLSRFVAAGTQEIRARVRYESPSLRQQFASNTDLFLWTIQ